jgi:hypothetical protein
MADANLEFSVKFAKLRPDIYDEKVIDFRRKYSEPEWQVHFHGPIMGYFVYTATRNELQE